MNEKEITEWRKIQKYRDGDVCKVEDCNKKAYCRFWCREHYSRWRRTGNPISTTVPKFCNVDGCNEEHSAKGFCRIHYSKFIRFGTPYRETHYESTDGICTVEKCGNKIFCRRVCRKHYQFFMRYRVDYSKKPTCYVCGTEFSWWNTRIVNMDHIHPKSRGGEDKKENFLPICRRCNHSKNNKTLPELIEWCKIVVSREEELLYILQNSVSSDMRNEVV
jgi:hypothetical protein